MQSNLASAEGLVKSGALDFVDGIRFADSIRVAAFEV
jgi:hypothetical protein